LANSVSHFRGAVQVAAFAFVVLPVSAVAQQQGVIGWTGGNTGNVNANLTVGWQFSLAQPVTVTHLGLWDYDGTGLKESHLVSIWDSGGTLMTSATVSGSGAGNWVWASVPSTTLNTGPYTIGARYISRTQDLVGLSADTVSTAPGVTHIKGVGGPWGSVPSIDYDKQKGYFGPNFRMLDPDPIPEPALVQLPVLLAMGAVCAWRRRAR